MGEMLTCAKDNNEVDNNSGSWDTNEAGLCQCCLEAENPSGILRVLKSCSKENAAWQELV